jgi:hypothetical protein
MHSIEDFYFKFLPKPLQIDLTMFDHNGEKRDREKELEARH